MSSPNSHAARLARVKGLSIRRSNASLPDAVGPRPDTSRRGDMSSARLSGGEGTQGIEAEAAARGTGGPEPPPAPTNLPCNKDVATAGSTTLVKDLVLLSEQIEVRDHPRNCLGWYPIANLRKKNGPQIAPDVGDDWPFLGDEKHKGRDWPCLIIPGGYSELEQCAWIDRGEYECLFVTLFCITCTQTSTCAMQCDLCSPPSCVPPASSLIPISNMQRPGNEEAMGHIRRRAEREQDNGRTSIAVLLGMRTFRTFLSTTMVQQRTGAVAVWSSEGTDARIERNGFPAQSPLSAHDQAEYRHKDFRLAVDEAKAIENSYQNLIEAKTIESKYQALMDEAEAIENNYQALIDAAAFVDDDDEGKDSNKVFAEAFVANGSDGTSQRRRRGGKKSSGTDTGLPLGGSSSASSSTDDVANTRMNAATSTASGDVIELLSSSSSSSEDSNDTPSDSRTASLNEEKGATGAKSSTSTDVNNSTTDAVLIDELRALAETMCDEMNSVDTIGSSSDFDRLLSTIVSCKDVHSRLRAHYHRSSMVNFKFRDRKVAVEFLGHLEKACQRATEIAQNFGSPSSAARHSSEIDQSSNGVIDTLPCSSRAGANANSPATRVDLGCLALYSNELAKLQKHLQEQNHSDLADALSSCTGLARQLKSLIDGSTQITFLRKADKVLSDMKKAIEKGSILIGESLNDPTSAPARTSIKPTPTGTTSAGTGPWAKKPRISYKSYTYAYQSRHFASGGEASYMYDGAAAYSAMAKEAHDAAAIRFPSKGATDAERCAFLAMALRESRFDPDPGSRNYGLCFAFRSFADASAQFVINYPNNMGKPVRRSFVHKRAVQQYNCLDELLKQEKTLTPSDICHIRYFPKGGDNMNLIHEYFEHGTISVERFEVELSMYNQVDW